MYILFKKVEQRRKKKGFNVTCSVPIGYTINTLGLKTFETKHNFKNGMGVYMFHLHLKKHMNEKQELFILGQELIKCINIDMYGCGMIQCYCNLMTNGDYIYPHKDPNDISQQIIFSFGDYQGGALRCYSADEMYYLDLDTKNTPHTIDARLYHEVLPFTGIRYTYVVYKTYDFDMNEASSIYDIVDISPKKKSTWNIILMTLLYKIIELTHRDNIPLVKKKVDILYVKYKDSRDKCLCSERKINQSKRKWDNVLKDISYDDLLLIMNHFTDKYNYQSVLIMKILDRIDYIWE